MKFGEISINGAVMGSKKNWIDSIEKMEFEHIVNNY